jgi:flagellar hook assembly protein FlgD
VRLLLQAMIKKADIRNKICYLTSKLKKEGEKKMFNLKVVTLVMLLSIGIGFVFAAGNSVLTSLNIEPNPMEKSTTVYLSFSKTVNVGVSVETLDGVVIKTIYTGRLNSGNHEFAWDRLDNNGEYVTEGSYYLVVSYDTRYTSTKKTLILK